MQIQTWNLWIPLICENSMLLSNKALAMMSRTLCHCVGEREENKLGQIQTWYHQNKSLSYRAGIVYSYRREDETLGPGVGHLNLLQRSHHCLHFGRVTSLTNTGRRMLDNGLMYALINLITNIIKIQIQMWASITWRWWRWLTLTGMSWSWLDDWVVNT